MNEDVIRIKKPAHFSWKECLWFLDRGYDDCLFTIDGNSIIKLVNAGNDNILVQVTEEKKHLLVTGLHHPVTDKHSASLIDYITEWFDLERDLGPFYALLGADKKLGFMKNEYRGLRLIGIPDLYEALCWSIIGQQINLPFAYKLKRRLVEQFGVHVEHEGKRHYAFPAPEVLAQVAVTDLLPLQFSVRKAEYVIGVAGLFASGQISKQQLLAKAGYEQMIGDLVAIRGIGLWTANYALMKSLKVMNSIPYGDTGLNKALTNHLDFPKSPARADIDQYFSAFEGWQAYLVFYLWRSLTHPKHSPAAH